MQKKIKFYNFRGNEPPVTDETYIVKDVTGNIYLDKWLNKPWTSYLGVKHDSKWETTHMAYVEEWAFIDNVSLREFVELTEN
jgi:hypothetical protein